MPAQTAPLGAFASDVSLPTPSSFSPSAERKKYPGIEMNRHEGLAHSIASSSGVALDLPFSTGVPCVFFRPD